MGISIGSNSQYFIPAGLAKERTKADHLEEKLKSKPATDEELMEVCKSFEAYLLEQAMKGMEKTIPREDEKNPYLEQFGDKLYEEYAKSATEQKGLGLAQLLYEAMKRNA